MKLTDEVKKNAISIFKAHPKEDVVLAFEDGNYFVGKNRHFAETHGNSKKIKPLEITRKEVMEAKEADQKTEAKK